MLDLVVLPLCRRLGLPLCVRMGTRRRVNTQLGTAGDGLGSARLESLSLLCTTHADLKFLATVLGRADQHEAAVLASRFRNLHIWGCWWYSSLPSIIAETSATRLELLGPQFTFQARPPAPRPAPRAPTRACSHPPSRRPPGSQASSARVHDQLVHKWVSARAVLTKLLAAKYAELMDDGWRVSRGDVRRDVLRLLGGAFEEFKQRKL